MKRDKGREEVCLALVVSYKSSLDGKLISLSFFSAAIQVEMENWKWRNKQLRWRNALSYPVVI